jgi:hypothetical protein
MPYTPCIARNYYQLLPYLFKRFSVLTARRTLFPTLAYYARRLPLPESQKPALFTMNIFPPMMTVWYHCMRKYIGDQVDVTIFDCSGTLNAADFPEARVQKFLNFYAATKSDEFLYHIAQNRKIGWICDDDIFLTGDAVRVLQREMHVPGTASVSFKPRTWWHFDIQGRQYEPSGSYCIAFNRELFVEKERLSLAPAEGNSHPSHIGKGTRRYDTGDKANEVLLQKGYRCCIVPEEERAQVITPFTGLSGAVMLLGYFRTPEELLDYFLSPEKKAWGGNVLYGTLTGVLSLSTIVECSNRITGREYRVPCLPPRDVLEKIRRDHEPYLRSDNTFQWVDEASEKLKHAL